MAQIKSDYNEEYERLQERTEREAENLAVYEQEATADIEAIRTDFEENKDKVGELLLNYIMEVKLDLPKVVVGNFEENMA